MWLGGRVARVLCLASRMDLSVPRIIQLALRRSPSRYGLGLSRMARWASGTKIHEVHRAPAGKRIAAVVVGVVEYEPDGRFGMRIIEGLPVHGQITFEPSSTGMRLRFRLYSQPAGNDSPSRS